MTLVQKFLSGPLSVGTTLPKKKHLPLLESHLEEEPSSLIARVRAAMPLIDANLKAGHSLRTVHQLLLQDGIPISYKLLALYRSRIKRGKTVINSQGRAVDPVPGRTPTENAESTPASPDGFDPAANFRKHAKKQVTWEYPSGPPDESKLV